MRKEAVSERRSFFAETSFWEGQGKREKSCENGRNYFPVLYLFFVEHVL